MALEMPHTYTGYGNQYDSSGNVTATNVVITSQTAQDANSYVNPSEVTKAVDDLKSTLKTSIDDIQGKLRNVSVDANGNMLKVEDATMEPIINAAADSLDQIMPSLTSTLDDIITFANTEHDKKQKEFNDAAESAVRNTSGVISVQMS